MTYCRGSGSSDPYFLLTDPDASFTSFLTDKIVMKKLQNMVFFVFLLYDGRIREAQKLTDLDPAPDPEHCFILMQGLGYQHYLYQFSQRLNAILFRSILLLFIPRSLLG
jgi:hypothetical protein